MALLCHYALCYNANTVFVLIDKLDKLLESKDRCTIIDKLGSYHHGVITDSWVRISGGKVRGKIRFQSDAKGEIEIDGNDILEILEEK